MERAGFLHIPPYPKGDQHASDPDNQAHLKSLKSAVQVVLKGLANRKSETQESAA